MYYSIKIINEVGSNFVWRHNRWISTVVIDIFEVVCSKRTVPGGKFNIKLDRKANRNLEQ